MSIENPCIPIANALVRACAKAQLCKGVPGVRAIRTVLQEALWAVPLHAQQSACNWPKYFSGMGSSTAPFAGTVSHVHGTVGGSYLGCMPLMHQPVGSWTLQQSIVQRMLGDTASLLDGSADFVQRTVSEHVTHLRLREVAFVHVLANGIHHNHCALGDAIASQHNILLCLPHLQQTCQLPDWAFGEGMAL